MKKLIKNTTFAILGLGGRGSVYAHFIRESARNIVAVCDPDERKREKACAYGVSPERFYADENEFFSQGKLADVLVIATLDGLHYRQAIKALDLGYDLLLEKPIALTLEECLGIEKKANALGRTVLVCHVLRYSPFYSRLKELLDEKVCGEIVSVSMVEEIGYYHYAHSYVRGNWRNEEISAPLILAKNCHDLDMICWLIGKDCEYISSFGDLRYFKNEKAPVGATAYCFECPHKTKCPYSAFHIYHNKEYERLAGLAKHGKLGNTFDEIEKSLHDKSNLYARCVYHSDNDVCDHQVATMQFNGGVLAQFQSTAFSETMSRSLVIYCENGKIYGEDSGTIRYQRLGEEEQVIQIKFEDGGYANHSGGDAAIIRYLLDYMEKGVKAKQITDISGSILSHKLGFLAEKSRKDGGKTLRVE